MKHNNLLIRFFVLFILPLHLLGQSSNTQTFHSLSEIWSAVKTNNIDLKNATLQSEIARLTYKTSMGNVINPRIPVSATLIDNTRLQQNFIPAEFFGGTPGTFRQITLGQQYNSLVSFQPQFDIINMASIAQVKAAKINMDLTGNRNSLQEYNLYLQVNSLYHNILSLQNQKKVVEENLDIANQILTLVKSRFSEGIARKQEVNEAEVNVIFTRDKAEQIIANLAIQKQLLQVLMDHSGEIDLAEELPTETSEINISPEKNMLAARSLTLESAYVQQDLRSMRYQYLPNLSFTSSFNWQNLSNDGFFNENASHISYNFVGLKLNWELPTVQRLASIKTKEYQLLTLKNQEEKAINEAESLSAQLEVEYQKASGQWKNYKHIRELKKDTYEKNMNQYRENILPLDRLLISQNDLLTAQLNEVTTLVTLAYQHNRILIHNQYK